MRTGGPSRAGSGSASSRRGPIDPRLVRRGTATRGYLVATVAVGMVQVACLVLQAWLLATVITGIVTAHRFDPRSAPALAGLAVVVLGRAGCAWLQQWLGHRAAARVKSELRRDLVAARLAKPYDPGVSTGRMVTLVGQGIDALDGWYAKYLPQLVLGVLAPLVVLVAVARTDPLSAVIIAVTLPLIPVFLVLVGLVTQQQLDRRWRAQAVLGHHFTDLVAGLTTLQAFGRARRQAAGLIRTEARHRTETMRTLRVAFLSALVLELLATLSVALVAVSVGLRVVDAQLALFPALFVLVLAPEAFLPLRQVGAHYHDAADGVAAADEALSIIERAEACDDTPPGARLAPVATVRLAGAATGATAPLTAECRAGEVTVLTGPSGCGKTTALHLVLGWLAPASGTVTLVDEQGGEHSVAEVAAAWRGQLAWVPQVPGLVPGTVADNIALGVAGAGPGPGAGPDAGPAAGRLRQVLDRCGGRDIALDHPVGDEGAGLSIGQRRRVALARALLRVLDGGARWLVLDEPTAGLDDATEAAVVAGLPAGIGVIMVSHRPAVIRRADNIVTVTPPPGATPQAPAPDTDSQRPSGQQPVSAARKEGLLDKRGVVLAGAVLMAVLAGGSGVGLIATAAWLLSKAAEHPPVLHLMVAVVGVRFFGLGKGVFRYVERLLGHQAALAEQSGLRIDTYRRLADRLLPVRGRHDLVNRLTQDVAATVDLTVRVLLPAAAAGVIAVGAVGLVAAFSPAAAVVLAVGVLVAAIGAPVLGDRLSRRTQRSRADRRGALAERVGLVHRLAAEFSAYGLADRELAAVGAADARLRAVERQAASASGVAIGMQVLALGAVSVVSLLVAAAQLGAGALDPTLVAVFALLPLALADVVAPLPAAALARTAARAALARVRRLGHDAAVVADDTRVSDATARATGRVRLVDASVGWGPGSPVLEGLSLDVAAGDRVAVVGPSGLGKTTLAATIAGMLPPLAGAVEVTGRVGLLSQDAHLFDTTVRENLRLADPGADDSRLCAALDRVGLGFDLDRRVGEHGGAVSGGEARRLALARLVLREVDVVVLDEPTEHLDHETADRLLTDIDRWWPDAVIVVITHDPALVTRRLDARVVDLSPYGVSSGCRAGDRPGTPSERAVDHRSPSVRLLRRDRGQNHSVLVAE